MNLVMEVIAILLVILAKRQKVLETKTLATAQKLVAPLDLGVEE
jgi:hypothetical protein